MLIHLDSHRVQLYCQNEGWCNLQSKPLNERIGIVRAEFFCRICKESLGPLGTCLRIVLTVGTDTANVGVWAGLSSFFLPSTTAGAIVHQTDFIRRRCLQTLTPWFGLPRIASCRHRTRLLLTQRKVVRDQGRIRIEPIVCRCILITLIIRNDVFEDNSS